MSPAMAKQGKGQACSLTEQRKNLFLSHFKHVMGSFTSSIEGTADEATQHFYASLVMDRFFALFFLQQQGLLDNNKRYLQYHLDVLHTSQVDTFFTYFFLPLCHTVLSGQAIPGKGYAPFGHIPILAHPLFQKHSVEDQYHLHISDKPLQQLFHFLETYRWELVFRTDLEPGAVHHDIFADLLEQRINQKQTGTYYTTEDITNYVGKNTIVPVLFQQLQKRYPALTRPSSTIWQNLIHSPDRYISSTLQNSVILPKETPQEYQLRMKRYTNLVTLLQQGTIRTINAMVTYNLDILRFTIDIISTQQKLESLVALFRTLEQLTILDPTCGSGAFLFAAFSILQTLYMNCLQCIQSLITSIDETVLTLDEKVAFTSSQSILAQIEAVPNINYFVVYHIITHNLYGVDLMYEATNVCTLRLYLTLLAHVQHIADIPPFDQIPIHIKIGNALVGDVYIAKLERKEVIAAYDYKKEKAFHWPLAFSEVAHAGGFAVIIGNPPYIEHSKIKHQYAIDGYEEKSCGNLYAAMLERSLALLNPNGSSIGLLLPMSICGSRRFAQLRTLLTQSLSSLWLANFDIFPSRLMGNAFQRLSILLAQSSVASSMQSQMYTTRILRWYPEERPYIIDLLTYTQNHHLPLSTSLQQLPLFPKLASPLHAIILQKIFARSHGHTLATVQQSEESPHFVYYQEATNYWIKALCHIPFYKKDTIAMIPPHGRFLFFRDEQTAQTIMAIMNSSLFYLWFATYSDGFHLAHTIVTSFPFSQELLTSPSSRAHEGDSLPRLANKLEIDLLAHTHLSTRNKRPVSSSTTGKNETNNYHAIELTEYQVSHSKQIIDDIDRFLARYYDFTMDELNFIIHYDLKYRTGRLKVK